MFDDQSVTGDLGPGFMSTHDYFYGYPFEGRTFPQKIHCFFLTVLPVPALRGGIMFALWKSSSPKWDDLGVVSLTTILVKSFSGLPIVKPL